MKQAANLELAPTTLQDVSMPISVHYQVDWQRIRNQAISDVLLGPNAKRSNSAWSKESTARK